MKSTSYVLRRDVPGASRRYFSHPFSVEIRATHATPRPRPAAVSNILKQKINGLVSFSSIFRLSTGSHLSYLSLAALLPNPRRALKFQLRPYSVSLDRTAPGLSLAVPAQLRLFQNALSHAAAGRTAITDPHLGSFTYGRLLEDALRLSSLLSSGSDLNQKRIAFLCPNDYSYVLCQWATWLAGGVAVPLCITHTPDELEYHVSNSDSVMVLGSGKHLTSAAAVAHKLHLPFHSVEVTALGSLPLPQTAFPVHLDREAMMIYTSGTTGKPKGVVHTHRNLEAMTGTLVQVWEYTSEDKLLQILPLHHIHGVINILTCGLWAGGHVEMLHFHAASMWERFLTHPPTVFTAVPTIYAKLLEAALDFDESKRALVKERMKQIRLMMSGSAALPEPFFYQWEELTGHRLLERFGMTEIGMALTNPYSPQSARTPGRVGGPLPGVEVRLKPTGDEKHIGEIFIKGPQVFKEYLSHVGSPLIFLLRYYRRPEATAETFDDGWFKTGDIAERFDDGTYKILGRHSVDILKSGGYKISALDVEREILASPQVKEAAVIGLPDQTWGQLICALVVPSDTTKLTEADLMAFLKDRLAPYKMPRRFIFLSDIPRNAMGKVNKKDLVKIYHK